MEAFAEIVVRLLQQIVNREIEIDAAGIARDAMIKAAQKAPERQCGTPRLQVPQGDIGR
jgi:hypothetical protein